MQEFDMETADLRRGVSMKSCIFKEGDDLRQDILALQIIEFFLKVGRGTPLLKFIKFHAQKLTGSEFSEPESKPDLEALSGSRR